MSVLQIVDASVSSPAQTATPYKAQTKRCVNLPAALDRRLHELAYQLNLSHSSIVQVALQQLFAQGDEARIGALLRELGASLRRK